MELKNRTTASSLLSKLGFAGLFLENGGMTVDGIWNEQGAPEILSDLAIDSGFPALPRFLAAEILFYKKRPYPPEEQKETLASIYAIALAQNFTLMANAWALPDIFEGAAGTHFVMLGNAATSQLLHLLNNEDPVYFAGSQEAMFGNSFKYRVKDLAAFFLAKIKDLPFPVYKTRARRDKSISVLRSKLI